MTKVLVVDDEPSLQTLLTYNLKNLALMCLSRRWSANTDIIHEQKLILFY